jgi:uncharacterized protein with HEPN domain
VVTEKGLHEYLRLQILKEAIPLWKEERFSLIHIAQCIDPVEVWLTVEKDLPTLKQAIVALLSTLPHVE